MQAKTINHKIRDVFNNPLTLRYKFWRRCKIWRRENSRYDLL